MRPPHPGLRSSDFVAGDKGDGGGGWFGVQWCTGCGGLLPWGTFPSMQRIMGVTRMALCGDGARLGISWRWWASVQGRCTRYRAYLQEKIREMCKEIRERLVRPARSMTFGRRQDCSLEKLWAARDQRGPCARFRAQNQWVRCWTRRGDLAAMSYGTDWRRGKGLRESRVVWFGRGHAVVREQETEQR